MCCNLTDETSRNKAISTVDPIGWDECYEEPSVRQYAQLAPCPVFHERAVIVFIALHVLDISFLHLL